MMNGDPIPKGGERQQPNPLFLAHAAALTELYVTLAVDGPSAGLSLLDYRREGEAREAFELLGKQRALAPDATVILADEKERKLAAFVELDLGTMSHTRLRQKADLYAAYTAADDWQERHLFLPALLFLTTTETRARRFLVALQSALAHNQRRYSRCTLVAGAGELARQPRHLLDGGCLTSLHGDEPLALQDVLDAARAPHEQMQRTNQKRRETLDCKRAQLHEDPATAREALRRFRDSHHCSYMDELEPLARQAIEILVTSSDAPSPLDQTVLQALVTDLEDALVQPGGLRQLPPSTDTKQAAALLATFYREHQRRLVDELAARHGEGPSLRHARRVLDKGELIAHHQVEQLPAAATNDATAHGEQHRLELAYVEWREQAARQMVRTSGTLGRLTRKREEFFPQIDRAHLTMCSACREIVFPTLGETRDDGLSARCHYCHARERLKPHREETQPERWCDMGEDRPSHRDGQSTRRCTTAGRQRPRNTRRPRQPQRRTRSACPPLRRLPDPDHEAFVEWFVAYWRRSGAHLFADQSRTEEASTHA